MATARTSGRPFQFSLKLLLAIVTASAILIGLFWPRVGPPLDGCAEKGIESVWIDAPSDAEVIAKCTEVHPEAALPANPPLVTEKVFEEVIRCRFFNFQGRRFLHRVRYRCEVYLNKKFPPESIVVLIDYDHYHLNGGGGGPVVAKTTK